MPFPWETVPPMAIICVATAAMGALPGFIHKGLYGKPKATGVDEWDRRVQASSCSHMAFTAPL